MDVGEFSSDLTLNHVEPVFAVNDVSQSVAYWHEVLGFPDKWVWGEPPRHGGVSWHGVFIQFSLNPELASRSAGNHIWIKVRQLDKLYQLHQERNVDIVSKMENKPWGVAEYMIRDINGYYIIFAGASASEEKKSVSASGVRIIPRIPTKEEYLRLINAVGWVSYAHENNVEKILAAPLFGVVAENETADVIGTALLLGDGVSFYYVKDVMVDPAWQRKRIGSAMMKKLAEWLDQNAPENAFVILITAETLGAFYQQFDFAPIFGMRRSIQKF